MKSDIAQSSVINPTNSREFLQLSGTEQRDSDVEADDCMVLGATIVPKQPQPLRIIIQKVIVRKPLQLIKPEGMGTNPDIAIVVDDEIENGNEIPRPSHYIDLNGFVSQTDIVQALNSACEDA